jgi:hypothetical protein
MQRDATRVLFNGTLLTGVLFTGAFVAGTTTLSFGATRQAAGDTAGGAAADIAGELAALRAANDALAAKVARLEQETDGSRWLTESRAAEIRGIVTDVLADASSRDSLAGAGLGAGWSKDQGGFFLASEDGSFKLNIKGQVQVRWAMNSRENGGLGATADKSSSWGFENRRTKLTFSGHVIDPSVTFEVKPIFNRTPASLSSGGQALSSGNIVGSVEDIWVQKRFDSGFSVRAGQFKAPFLREELVSSGAQLAVERSLVNDLFSTKFAQGVQVEFGGGKDDSLRATLFYGDGLRANASRVPSGSTSAAGSYAGSYTTAFNANPTDYAFAGRVEHLGAGSWRQMRDLTSFRGEDTAWMLGFGAMAQSLRPTAEGPLAVTATDSMWGVTADLTVDFGGANLFVYGVYRDVALAGAAPTRGGGTSDSFGQWGVVVQGGVFVSDEVELFARYELGDTGTDRFRVSEPGVELKTASVATVGLNWYIGGSKDLKWSTDVGLGFAPVGDFASSGADWLGDGSSTAGEGSTNDGQWVVRTQLQLLF